ncbi:Uncharacterised protein (plasmid) [Mycoplasmopsis gallopavonis]|uniref:Uncharacterized protein n=1 Tax=Mycoplasmopsis gallopavonis TaxID=76629 RepID=A0A449B0B3_9BACT|nr:hypothetical protein [Mycoplasmopsis gallopavonis]VEU73231.1 Uncharacterised protein [Mycoplasmopsis gallopavonis]
MIVISKAIAPIKVEIEIPAIAHLSFLLNLILFDFFNLIINAESNVPNDTINREIVAGIKSAFFFDLVPTGEVFLTNK